MLEQLFKALGIVTINSKASEKGDYYEYHLLSSTDGTDSIVRTKRNSGVFGGDESVSEPVETDEQLLECKQALMYNYPQAFTAGGAIAIDLTQGTEKVTDVPVEKQETDETEEREEQGVAGGADTEQETDSSAPESGTEVEPTQQPY